MLKKQDHQFFDILDDLSKGEKRLLELMKQRFLFGVSAAMMTASLLVLLAVNLRDADQTLQIIPALSLLAVGFASLTSLTRTIAAHGEIRTLLTFKKLREMRLSD
jgi:hypothetical protein